MTYKNHRSCFTALQCINVDGYCPDIPTEYDDREYSNGVSCEECMYNTYECVDCLFRGSEFCPEGVE